MMARAEGDLLQDLLNTQPGQGHIEYQRPEPAAKAQSVKGYERTKPRKAARQGLLYILAPGWALKTEARILEYSADFRAIIAVFSLLITGLGLAMFAGGGYYSIQAVRLLLSALGLSVAVAGIPAVQWWLIPLANSAIQLVGRRTLRPAWWLSLWYDATTTGVGIMSRGSVALAGVGLSLGAVYGGILGAVIGMVLATGAEALFFGGLFMLHVAARR